MKTIFTALVIVVLFSFNSKAQSLSTPISTTRSDTLQAGMQGSVNPLSENVMAITGDELLDQSFPGSWPLYGSGIRMKIGGYVKGVYIQDLDYVGDRYEFELGSIAVDGSPEQELGGIATMHSKESRFNLEFRSKAKWNDGKEFPMQVFVEVDWFFDSPSMRYNTRLRHAYGVIGRLLVGRSWTTSGDLSSLPGTIDFAGGDALYGGRTTQIRWQDQINKNFTYAIALEDAFSQIDNVYNQDGASRLLRPNLAGMIKYKADKGSSVQLGVDAFPISWKGPATVPNISKTGYAVTVTGRLLFKGADYHNSLGYGGGFGEGQAHKIIALSWDGKASGALTQTDLHLNPAWFAFVGYSHYWTKSLNSTFSTHWAGTQLHESQADNTIAKAGSVHANLIWFPYKLVSLGAEYMWGMRENKNGVQGQATRLQFMVKFKFN